MKIATLKKKVIMSKDELIFIQKKEIKLLKQLIEIVKT